MVSERKKPVIVKKTAPTTVGSPSDRSTQTQLNIPAYLPPEQREQLAIPKAAQVPNISFVDVNREPISGNELLDPVRAPDHHILRQINEAAPEGSVPTMVGQFVIQNRSDMPENTFTPGEQHGQTYGVVTNVVAEPGRTAEYANDEMFESHQESCGHDTPWGSKECLKPASEKASGQACVIFNHMNCRGREAGSHHPQCPFNGNTITQPIAGAVRIDMLQLRAYKMSEQHHTDAFESQGTQGVNISPNARTHTGPAETFRTANFDAVRKAVERGSIEPGRNEFINLFRNGIARKAMGSIRNKIARGQSLGLDPSLLTNVVERETRTVNKSTSSPGKKPSNPVVVKTRRGPVKPVKKGYANPAKDQYIVKPPCRFCDDPAHWSTKGDIVQTGTAEDGRPLYAHPECVPSSVSDSLSIHEEFERLSSFRIFNAGTEGEKIKTETESDAAEAATRTEHVPATTTIVKPVDDSGVTEL